MTTVTAAAETHDSGSKNAGTAIGDYNLLIAALTDKIDNSGSSVADISLLLLWFAEISFDVFVLKDI